MRILHVLNELRASGLETMLAAAAEYWRREGIEGEILAIGACPGPYAETLSQAGYPIHFLRLRRSFGFLVDVFRFFRNHRYDGVHIHCEQANFWYALLASLAGHRRIARSVHSIFRFGGRLRARRRLQRWVMRRVLGVRTIAVGASVRTAEWEVYRNPSEEIPNWYNEAKIQVATSAQREAARRLLGIPGERFVLLTVGNCSDVKNHAAVIRAVGLVPPSVGVLYLHAGCEEEGEPERRVAIQLGIQDRIRFLGPVLEITPLLQAADLFLMPSLHEGLGIAAVEAMAAAVPVVLADVEGLRDLRPFAPGAVWVPPEADAIAEAILHFAVLEPRQRREIGLRLSREIRQRCGLKAGAGRYVELYRQMVRA